MLDQVIGLFGIVPDIDLDLMQPSQTLADLTARVVVQVDRVLREEDPDVVIVQGDTTTVMAASMAAFYRNVKVAHVEAGLRSGCLFFPFPEGMDARGLKSIVFCCRFHLTEPGKEEFLLHQGLGFSESSVSH